MKKSIQQVQDKRVYSEIRNRKKKKEEDWDYFNDCYICQQTKKVEEEEEVKR